MKQLGMSYYDNSNEKNYRICLNKDDFEQHSNHDVKFILDNVKKNQLMTSKEEYSLAKDIFNERQNIYKLLMAFPETAQFFSECSNKAIFDHANNVTLSKNKFAKLSEELNSLSKKIKRFKLEKSVLKCLSDFYNKLNKYKSYYDRIKIATLYNTIKNNKDNYSDVLKIVFSHLEQSYVKYFENTHLFCEKNLRMVIAIAKPFFKTNTHIPEADIIQFGNEGLFRSIHKFDYRKNIKFSTYATYWIRQSIMRNVDEYKLIHVPVNKVSFTRKINKLLDIEERITGERDLSHLSKKYSLPLKDVINSQLIYSSFCNTSLDIHVQEDEDSSTILDLISLNNQQNNQYDKYKNEEMIKNLIKYAESAGIEKRDIFIVLMRYGICFDNNSINYDLTGKNDGNKEHMYTLDEIGNKLGVSRERVRQLEKRFFNTIRKSRFAEKLKTYIADFREA